MIKEIFVIILFFGALLLSLHYVGKLDNLRKEKIVYKYIPATTQELYDSPTFVSDIFADMFNSQTPWTDNFRL